MKLFSALTNLIAEFQEASWKQVDEIHGNLNTLNDIIDSHINLDQNLGDLADHLESHSDDSYGYSGWWPKK